MSLLTEAGAARSGCVPRQKHMNESCQCYSFADEHSSRPLLFGVYSHIHDYDLIPSNLNVDYDGLLGGLLYQRLSPCYAVGLMTACDRSWWMTFAVLLRQLMACLTKTSYAWWMSDQLPMKTLHER